MRGGSTHLFVPRDYLIIFPFDWWRWRKLSVDVIMISRKWGDEDPEGIGLEELFEGKLFSNLGLQINV